MNIFEFFESNLGSQIFAGIAILIISAIGVLGYRFYKEQKEITKLLNNANESYSKKKYLEALPQYLKIIDQYHDKIDRFSLGHIYSNVARCYLEDLSFKKNSNKIQDGIDNLNNAIMKFDITKYPLKYSIFRVLNIIDTIIMSVARVQKIFNYQNFGYFRLLALFRINSIIFQFAGTKNDLAIAYCKMGEIRNPSENYENAIIVYQGVLKIYTFDHFPVDHMQTTENLITTYNQLAKYKDSRLNFQRADALRSNLIINMEKKPKLFEIPENTPEFAEMAFGSGNQLISMYNGQNQQYRFLEVAITSFIASLNVYTAENFSYKFAMIQNNLGIAHVYLALYKDRTNNLEIAIECFEKALLIRTENLYPPEFGQTSHNLAMTWYAIGDESTDLEKKLRCFSLSLENSENALRIRNIETYPIDYAETQFNRALTYLMLSNLQNGTQNLKYAKKYFKEAEIVFLKQKYPEKNAQITFFLENIERGLKE